MRGSWRSCATIGRWGMVELWVASEEVDKPMKGDRVDIPAKGYRIRMVGEVEGRFGGGEMKWEARGR